MDQLFEFTLTEIVKDTEDVTSFVFKPASDTFSWEAGQYLDWQVPHENADDRGERRLFSIASAPSEGQVMLSSRFTSDGSGSTLKKHLATLGVGDVLAAKGPFGDFTLPTVDRDTILIAGGIGITPFRAILVDLAKKQLLENVRLLWGNRYEANVPYNSQIDSLAQANPGFQVDYTYSPAILNAELIKEQVGGDLSGKNYMISGLEKMVKSIREVLIGAGVEASAIRIDDFGGYDHHLEKPIF